MKEFVTANGSIFECENVSTGINSITLTMQGHSVDELESFFGGVTELTTSFGEEEQPHGTYKNLKLEDIVYHVETGFTSVVMRIKSEIEQRLDALEASQEIQDNAIERLETEEKQRYSSSLS